VVNTRPFLYPALAAQAVGAAIYLWLQPGGFAFGSRSFLEHQVIVPAFFAVAIATLAAVRRRPQVAYFGMGLLGGFWIAVGATALAAGSTLFSKGMALVVAGAVLAMLGVHRFGGPVRIHWVGSLPGLMLGISFWACAWAPPASTRPSGARLDERPPVEGPLDLEKGGLSVRIDGLLARVAAGEHRAEVRLAPFLFAVSDRGTWSLFDFRSVDPPAWKVSRVEGDALDVRTSCPDFDAHGRIWIAAGKIRMRIGTTFKREIAAHLATALTVRIPGGAAIEGHPWNPGDPSEFIAFREGRMEFLRASHHEKGPFETLAFWPPHDPVLDIGGWRVEVLGWADQASRSESPTAGWGISQGAIERVEDEFLWEFAATSIGRGWHTVRTAPGTYVLEVVLSRP
jgi:hypothetical protein